MNALLFTSYLLLVPAPKMDEPINPFARAKVGDWVEYRMTVGGLPGGQVAPPEIGDMRIRMVVTAITEKTATVELQHLMGNAPQNAQLEKQIVDLTKPYDRTAILDFGKKGGGKREKIADGSEKITVGGKSYDCTWITVKENESGIDDVKIWFSKEILLAGMLKMEAKAAMFAITVELTGSGRK